MRFFFLLAIGSAVFVPAATPVTPIGQYKTEKGLAATDVVYQWTADLIGDGSTTFFLCLKESFDEDKTDLQAPTWRVYLPQSGVPDQVLSTGVNEGDGIGPGLPQIDIDRMFVGQISQLGKRGIVTLHVDTPRAGPRGGSIVTYVVEGDHLVSSVLVQYDSDIANPIFKQYLTDAVRTKVTLAEIHP
jgi:hypothetical protein